MTAPLDLDALRDARNADGMRGTWSAEPTGPGHSSIVLTDRYGRAYYLNADLPEDDAAAIVALMNAAPRMLAELEAARALIKAYEDEPASSDDDCRCSSELLAALSAYDAATCAGR